MVGTLLGGSALTQLCACSMNEKDDWINGKDGPKGAKPAHLELLAWSPDDKLLLIMNGFELYIVDAATKRPLISIRDLTAAIPPTFGYGMWSLACWSPDGSRFAASAGRTVYLYSPRNSNPVKAHRNLMRDEANLRSELKKRQPWVLKVSPERLEEEFRKFLTHVEYSERRINSLSWNHEGTALLVSQDTGFYLWPVKSDKDEELHKYSSGWSGNSANFAPNGRLISVTDTDMLLTKSGPIKHYIRIYEYPGLHQLYEHMCGYYPGDLYWSPKSDSVAWPDSERNVWLIDPRANKMRVLCTFTDNYSPHLAWSPDARYLAVHNPLEGVEIFDTASGARITTYRQELPKQQAATFVPVTQAHFAWSHDGRRIALGRVQEQYVIWSPKLG
jgi:WD40 repeat protein